MENDELAKKVAEIKKKLDKAEKGYKVCLDDLIGLLEKADKAIREAQNENK